MEYRTCRFKVTYRLTILFIGGFLIEFIQYLTISHPNDHITSIIRASNDITPLNLYYTIDLTAMREEILYNTKILNPKDSNLSNSNSSAKETFIQLTKLILFIIFYTINPTILIG